MQTQGPEDHTVGLSPGSEQVSTSHCPGEGWLESVPSLPSAHENTQYVSHPADCVTGKWAMALPVFNPFKAWRHPI